MSQQQPDDFQNKPGLHIAKRVRPKERGPTFHLARLAKIGNTSLVPDGATLWAGPARAGTREQRCCTKWANRIGGGRNRGQFPAQGRLLRSMKQIKEKQNPSCRGGDSEDPTEHSKIRVARGRPHEQRKGNRENEAYPFEEAANFRVSVGSLTTHFALPAFPKAHRQNRDPEEVPHIEGPDGNGSTRRPAPKAVVITKRNSLRPEVVGTANDEHGDWSEVVQRYISLRCNHPLWGPSYWGLFTWQIWRRAQ